MARCSERIWVDRWHTQCSRKAVIERDGRTYCRIHDPEYIEIKRAKRKAKYQVRTHPDSGTAEQRDNWKFEVVDFSLLPNEYKMPDAVKIGKVVRAGLHIIPGCRIFNQPSELG